MSVQRILGARFASVHGPADERKLAVWTLDLGFSGLLVAPTPRPVDWRALRSAAGDLPFDLPVARLVSANAHGIASASDGERRAAVAELTAGARAAVGNGIRTVVIDLGRVPVAGEAVESGADELADPASDRWTRDAAAALFARRGPGRDAALDRVCRVLYELTREFPDLTFALRPAGTVTGVADPAGLSAVFEDLAGRRLAYWHEAAVAAKRNQWLGEEQGGWLEAFAHRMVGLALQDAAESGPGSTGALPGSGLVDYAMLASYLGRGVPLPAVVDLDPGVDPVEIAGVQSFLAKFGL